MKPFNIQEAKLGKAIVTRSGREALYVAHVPSANQRSQFIFSVEGTVFTCDEAGKCLIDEDDDIDLFMKDVEVKHWVNVFEHDVTKRWNTSSSFPSKSIAKKNIASKDSTYLFTVRLKPKKNA